MTTNTYRDMSKHGSTKQTNNCYVTELTLARRPYVIIRMHVNKQSQAALVQMQAL